MRSWKKEVILMVGLVLIGAALTGCATGSPVTVDDFNALLSGAQELWVTFIEARAELQEYEAQGNSADKPDELARLEAEAIRLWDAYESLRDMVQGSAIGSQKAAAEADLYDGPMPDLR